MREILFRGKRIANGKWVTGYVFKQHNMIEHRDDYYIRVYDTDYIVFPETVGQYTGVTDKNGTKIFEGDIVKNSRFNKIEEVRYINKRKRIMFCGINYIVDLEYINEIYYEVIGNIYDNPELLEDGEEDD